MFQMRTHLKNVLHGLLCVAARAVSSLSKPHSGHVLTKATMASSQPEYCCLAFSIKLVDGVTCRGLVMGVSPGFHMVLFEDTLDFLVGCWHIRLLHSAALLGQFVRLVVS